MSDAVVIGVPAFVVGLVLGARYGMYWWVWLRGESKRPPGGRLNG